VKSWPCDGSAGYLLAVEITRLHSRRWAGTLVVTAAAAFIAGSASPALAQAGDAMAAGPDRRAAARSSVMASPRARLRGDASPTQYPERHAGPGVVRSVLLALVLPLALAGLALLAGAAWRRRIARGPTTIGSYPRGRDAAEFRRHKAVIERACSQRGWTLAGRVRDGDPARAGGRKRSGRAYALEQLADGDASRLVTGRLDHLAGLPRRLGAMLEWCAGHGVDLVAVDVELGTSTHDGRMVVGRLLSAASERGRARCAAHGTEAPRSGYSPRIPQQTGRTDRGPMAPQGIVALIGRTR
jgi:resolvase-like protein